MMEKKNRNVNKNKKKIKTRVIHWENLKFGLENPSHCEWGVCVCGGGGGRGDVQAL